MAKSDDRILSFFVSGALLAGTAACTKNTNETEPKAKTNTGDHEEHVNEGPVEQVLPTKDEKAKPITGAPPEPIREPDRVNTNHIVAPEMEPPDETNTGRQEELEPKPEGANSTGDIRTQAPPHRTNVGRETNPQPKQAPFHTDPSKN